MSPLDVAADWSFWDASPKPSIRRSVSLPVEGKARECATFLALRRRFGAVSYWRDEGEVDFVVQDGARIIPVPVSEAGPLERHHRALTAFYGQGSSRVRPTAVQSRRDAPRPRPRLHRLRRRR